MIYFAKAFIVGHILINVLADVQKTKHGVRFVYSKSEWVTLLLFSLTTQFAKKHKTQNKRAFARTCTRKKGKYIKVVVMRSSRVYH